MDPCFALISGCLIDTLICNVSDASLRSHASTLEFKWIADNRATFFRANWDLLRYTQAESGILKSHLHCKVLSISKYWRKASLASRLCFSCIVHPHLLYSARSPAPQRSTVSYITESDHNHLVPWNVYITVPHAVDQLVAWKTDVCWCIGQEKKATSQETLQA
jgi:hypothetical protein